MKKVILFISIFFAGCTSLPEAVLSPVDPSLKVVTYNINWGVPNPQGVLRYLFDVDADIICLQETHSYWESFLKKHLVSDYPHSFFHSSSGAGGIAIMSRYPLKNVRPLMSDAGYFPALTADVDTPLGNIQVLNVHLRPPLSDSLTTTISAYVNSPAIHQLELNAYLKSVDLNGSLIITGDFNENEQRAAVKGLLNTGFSDALSIFDTKSKTWFWKVFPGFTLSAHSKIN